MLIRHANQVVSRRELMEQIWKTEYLGDTRTLDVHVRWLRERIEPVPKSPEILKTVRGVGYQLVVPGGQAGAIREEIGIRGLSRSRHMQNRRPIGRRLALMGSGRASGDRFGLVHGLHQAGLASGCVVLVQDAL